MKKAVFILLALCIMISCFPNTAKANDAMIVGGTGGTVYAISNSDVEMEEEIIDITVMNGRSYVSCQFFFHNTGDGTSLLMGFPTGHRSEEPEDEDYEGPEDEYVTELNRFRTFIHGRKVPVEIKDGLKPEGNNKDELYFPQWYTWKVTFAANERVKIVNKYWMTNTSSLSYDWEEINYILRSGATWRGTIGKVTVRMKFRGYNAAGIDFREMQPSYIKEDGTIVWEAENIEPQEDIRLYYEISSFEYEKMDNPFDCSDERYDEYDRMQERMIRNFDIGQYNGTTWWGNRLLKKFGDNQSNQFYYSMGISYYKLGIYDKALGMLHKVKNKQIWVNDPRNTFYSLSLYYQAVILKKTGDGLAYNDCLEKLAACGYDWLQLWAQSRLDDLGEAC